MPLKPLSDNEIDDQQRALIAPFVRTGRDHAVFRTMLRHPDAMQAFLGWGQYILSENNSLSSRQRELLILWVGAARNCEYEFLRHAKIARRLGFSEDELRRLATGDGSGWPASEQLLLAVNRRPKRTPYRRAKGTPFVKQRDGYGGRTVRAGCGVGRA